MLEAVDQREEEVIGGEDRIRHIGGDVGAALGGERAGLPFIRRHRAGP